MQLVFVQFMTGLASAASLFLVASGLSIIFGVTRIVNFAHGAFYMLGAYVAYTLTEQLSGAIGFWFALLAAAVIVAALGCLLEMVLLRRIYHAPELFQLLATFGVTLMVEDLVLLIWGPEDLVGPRAPGMSGAVVMFGKYIPTYDLFLIALGPIVLVALWLLFHRTRWGVLVRAATHDRGMVAALGINQKWLFTGVFALGVFLAAIGGALQIPRDAVNHSMDLSIIVEAFVVVVIGGLGSTTGAFLAAILVSELNAFGILVFPKISLVLVFLVMAVVLVVRPWGFFGKPQPPQATAVGNTVRPWRPLNRTELTIAGGVVLVIALLPFVLGNYALTIGSEILIFTLFAASLHLLMTVGGLASFGHAAYFGLGAYGAAFAATAFGMPMVVAILAGPVLAAFGAAIVGWFAVSLSGVYFAMLTLAFAQIVWSIAFQWVDVTGGDNGILGIWPDAFASSPSGFFWMTLAFAVPALALLQMVIFSPFGFALRATRDSELRSESIGIDRKRTQWVAFVVAGAVAGLGGALFAFLKGSVFPDFMSISVSIDGLVMVLLGGIETVLGPIVGAIVFKALSIWLISQTDYSKLVLGLAIIAMVVAFPKGIVGTLADWRAKFDARRARKLAGGVATAAVAATVLGGVVGTATGTLTDAAATDTSHRNVAHRNASHQEIDR
ncbi:ABC transporter permease protein [Rhodovulum sp. PH10]|uniref:ABC transporter permease n=1 Tax=Rhodovulum sp. PH10 TaxID=1187851 RepID=UPI00027C234D|nr:ABC transporter permease [Rhodovulum sp. PH10]EJW12343.1 ABC transporter permease protein [Rhodovulum sp. PH10]